MANCDLKGGRGFVVFQKPVILHGGKALAKRARVLLAVDIPHGLDEIDAKQQRGRRFYSAQEQDTENGEGEVVVNAALEI